MLEIKEERSIVKRIMERVEQLSDDTKEVTIKQNEKEYLITIVKNDDNIIEDKLARWNDKNISDCTLLYHIKNKDAIIKFI